jgi:hypothetical protein
LSFEPNQGQARAGIQYSALAQGYGIHLADHGIYLVYANQQSGSLVDHIKSQWLRQLLDASGDADTGARTVELELLNGTSSIKWQGLEQLPGQSNYFRGSQPSQWHRRVPHFARVSAKAVYPGIDMTFYDSAGKLEYDFAVAPGADPGRIRLLARGAGAPNVAADGTLEWKSSHGPLRLQPPVAYQDLDGHRQRVAATYTVRGAAVGISLGDYDRKAPLIIDPVLDFSAVLGGDNSTWPMGMAVDAQGNVYVSGFTCSAAYPSTAGSADPRGGADTGVVYACDDAFVTKLSADGTTLIYSTFIGGSSYDFGARLALDSAGEVYLTGGTSSADFPVTAGAYQTRAAGGVCAIGLFPCGDAFVSKLSADGSTLLYSTYVGGTQIDFGAAIAIDSAGNAYVVGASNSADFPVSASAAQKTFNGASNTCFHGQGMACLNGIAFKLSANGSQLLYATYLTGTEQTIGMAIAVDSAGEAYLAGSTAASDFPTTAGSFQPTAAFTFASQYHGFVGKLSADGSRFLYSTYIGGSGSDYVLDLKLDSSGNAYLTGTTTSTDFPTTAGAYQTSYGGSPAGLAQLNPPSGCFATITLQTPCGDVFVARLNATGTALGFATYLGGAGGDSATSLSLDSAGDIWITGATVPATQVSGSPAPTPFPTTADAYLTTPRFGEYYGAFLAEMSPNASQLLFSSLLMPGLSSVGTAVSVDSNGDIYLTGQIYNSVGSITDGSGPLTTFNAYNGDTPGSTSVGGAYVMRFSTGAAPAAQLSATTLTFPLTTAGASSAPQLVTLTNTGASPLIFGLSFAQYPVSPFSQTSNCTGTLAINASCVISVVFTPQVSAANAAQGSLSDTLALASNAPGINTVALTGAVNDPLAVAFVPATLNFGDQAAGTTTASYFSQQSELVEQSAVFLQGGSSPNVTSVTVGGANPGDFNVDLTDCAVGPSGCSVTASFVPSGAASGSRSATVTVGSSAAGSPFVLTLTGNAGTGAQLQFYPQSVEFIPQTVGVTSTNSGGVYLWNTGSAPLSITAYNFPADYVLVAVGDSANGICSAPPIQIAPQSSCEILFQFKPTQVGNRNSTVTFTSNSVVTPATLSLLGTGAPANGAQLQVSPHSFNFGSAQVGTTLNEPTFIGLGNSGNAPLTYTISYSGDFASPPASSGGNCASPLAAGGFCELGVTFAPTASGPRTGSVTITSNAPDSPSIVALSGTGVLLPTLTLAPAAVNFGPSALNTLGPAINIGVTNPGNGPLTVSAASVTGPFVLAHNGCTSTIAPAGSCTISVSAMPVVTGEATGALLISSNSEGQHTPVALSVFGTTGAALRVSPVSLSFGNQPALTQSTAQAVTVVSTGSAGASLSPVIVNGDFTQTNNCPTSLAAGSSCTINVSFLPSADTSNAFPPTIVGNVSVGGSFSGSPLLVALSGVGTSPTGPVPNFTLALSPTSGTIAPGQSVHSTVTLTPSNGFNQSVSLSCSGLPAGAACSFSSSPVQVSGAAAISTLIITTTAVAMNSSGAPISPAIAGSFLIATFALPMAWRRRREVGRLIDYGRPALLVICIVALQSCGGSDASKSSSGTSLSESSSSGSSTSGSSSSGSTSSGSSSSGSSSSGSSSSGSSSSASSSSGGSSSGGSTGTPAGTYPVNITATAGAITQMTTYLLTVN